MNAGSHGEENLTGLMRNRLLERVPEKAWVFLLRKEEGNDSKIHVPKPLLVIGCTVLSREQGRCHAERLM